MAVGVPENDVFAAADAVLARGERPTVERVFTALNLLPSMAMIDWEKRLRLRQSTTNCRQTLRMALPLSRRKSAIVLKSGANRPVSHISSTLRSTSRSSRRLD